MKLGHLVRTTERSKHRINAVDYFLVEKNSLGEILANGVRPGFDMVSFPLAGGRIHLVVQVDDEILEDLDEKHDTSASDSSSD